MRRIGHSGQLQRRQGSHIRSGRPEPGEPEVEPAIAPSFDPADFRQDDPDAAGAEIGAEPVEADEVPVSGPAAVADMSFRRWRARPSWRCWGRLLSAPPPFPVKRLCWWPIRGFEGSARRYREPSTASGSVIFNERWRTVSPEDEALVSRDQTDGATERNRQRHRAGRKGNCVQPPGILPPSNGTIVSMTTASGSNVPPVDRRCASVPNSTLTADPRRSYRRRDCRRAGWSAEPDAYEVAATPAQAPPRRRRSRS